jgi:hypothetical protein
MGGQVLEIENFQSLQWADSPAHVWVRHPNFNFEMGLLK